MLQNPPPLLIFGEKASLAVSEDKILLTDNESEEMREISFEQEDDYYLQLIEFHEAITGSREPSVSTSACAPRRGSDSGNTGSRRGKTISLHL